MVYKTRLNESFYSSGDDDGVLQMMQDAYSKNAQANQSYWLEGTKDVRFKAGDQTLWNELYHQYPAFQRQQFNFNKIRRIINMVTGYQRRNRKATTCLPIEGSDEETADQFTSLLNWVGNRANVYDTLSDGFEGALTTGMNLLSVWMDYRSDPISGDVRLDNLSYNGFMIDQFFTKQDLSDCNFIWTRRYLSKKQAVSLMPEREKDIMELQGGQRDDKFSFLPENININDPDLLSYDEFWYLDYRDQKILIDKVSGETLEWTGDNERLKLFLQQFPQIQVKKAQKQTTKLAIVIGGVPFYNGPNPYNIDRYPFVPVIGYFEPDIPYYEWKIQGMVRALRDSQFLYNRRKVIELDILESQINSGLKVMEDSLVDDNDAFMSGQGKALFIKKDAPQGMASVEQIPAPGISSSMMALSESLSNELMEISGVNEELLGSADDDKAGILSMLRQGAGLTTLQKLFDQLDSSQKLLGELTMDLMQSNFTPGKVSRILGKAPAEQFYNKAFEKFDCVIAEGMLTETQRKAQFVQYSMLKEMGIPVPTDLLIDVAPVVQKKELKEAIAAQEQQQQQQQQIQTQIQMQEIEARTNLANSRALADKGLGIERISRVEENKALAVERRAEAVKDLEMASLDKIKAAKELAGIDLTQLQQLIDILDRLKVKEEVKAQEQLSPLDQAAMQTASSLGE